MKAIEAASAGSQLLVNRFLSYSRLMMAGFKSHSVAMSSIRHYASLEFSQRTARGSLWSPPWAIADIQRGSATGYFEKGFTLRSRSSTARQEYTVFP